MIKDEIDPRIQQWADILVNYSLATQFKERGDSVKDKLVVIHGEDITKPLMLALEYSIIKAGGHPYLNINFSTHLKGTTAGIPEMESGTENQLIYVPKFSEEMNKEAYAQIFIAGTSAPYMFKDFQSGVSKVRKAIEHLTNIRLSKPWVVTLFPTDAESVLEGFPTQQAYKDFIINASVTDYAKLAENQKQIKALMESSEFIRLKTYDKKTSKQCELEILISDNIVESCIGLNNVPDGEVFTSPVTSGVNGTIFFDVPVIYNGAEMDGVYLEIKDGIIINYRAEKGFGALKEIIETDYGSYRIGEIAIGTNPNVQRALKHPLFAEKIGGTCHIAIGKSYVECYSELIGKAGEEKEKIMENLIAAGKYNKSAQHVDIPVDFRNPEYGQAVFIGNTEIKWNKDKGFWEPIL
jgi:aminopeptidase